MYAFDPASGLCLPFYYGGCGGNENRFETAEDCYRTCDDDDPAHLGPADCTLSTDCIPTPMQCCGACGPQRWDNVVGVTLVGSLAMLERCGPIACTEPCVQDLSFAWFDAVCREGHCVAYDARETAMTECVDASDCVLRNGLQCCEFCSFQAAGVVAVNRDPDGSGSALRCEHNTELCPYACTDGYFYPRGASADCSAGRCYVAHSLL
jgi:hypothetical protein